MQQLKLFQIETRKDHGGSLVKGKRIEKRPLSKSQPIHLVLKSNPEFNLRVNKELVETMSLRYALSNGIRIYSMSVQKDHVHYCIKIEDFDLYERFVRSLTGVLSRRLGKGLWKYRPYTRVGSWGRDFKGLKKYIQQNELEACGVISYQPRGKSKSKFISPKDAKLSVER